MKFDTIEKNIRYLKTMRTVGKLSHKKYQYVEGLAKIQTAEYVIGLTTNKPPKGKDDAGLYIDIFDDEHSTSIFYAGYETHQTNLRNTEVGQFIMRTVEEYFYYQKALNKILKYL